MRRLAPAAVVLVPLLAAAAALAWPSVSVSARFASVSTFLRDPRSTAAITYDSSAVPAGAMVVVRQSANDLGGMNVALRVNGLRPDASYDAKLHVKRCTSNPAGAGGPFQNSRSTQSYAANEFRLDFRTGAGGSARVLTEHYWGIAKGQEANSVEIGLPGAKQAAACVTVPFARLNPGW